MKARQWNAGPNSIYELSEYVNLGVLKNYCGSFDKNIDETITKTRKKAGMLFSANFDRRRTNPLIYVKFWKKACIPALLFGAELWTVTKTGLNKLEGYQRWFLKKLFYLSDYIESSILYIISGLPTISILLHQKRLYFLGRIISLKKIPKVVSGILRARLQTLDDNNLLPLRVFLVKLHSHLRCLI